MWNPLTVLFVTHDAMNLFIGSGFSSEQILMRPTALVVQTLHNGRLPLCRLVGFAVSVDHAVIGGKTQADAG